MPKQPKPPKIGEKVLVWKGQGETREVIKGVVIGCADDYGDTLVYVGWVDPQRGPKLNGFYVYDVLPAPKLDRVPVADYPAGWRSNMRWVSPVEVEAPPSWTPDWTHAQHLGDLAAQSFPRVLRVVATSGGWATILLQEEREGSTYHFSPAWACVVAWSKKQPTLAEAIATVERIFG